MAPVAGGLFPGGHRSATNFAPFTLSEVYQIVAERLCPDLPLPVPLAAQMTYIQQALQRTPRTLLVLDAVETMEYAPLLSWIRRLAAPTKAVLTSRLRLDLPTVQVVPPLSPPAARELLVQVGAAHNLCLTATELDVLTAGAYGNPQALTWAVTRLVSGQDTVSSVLTHIQSPTSSLWRSTFAPLLTAFATQNPPLAALLPTLSAPTAPPEITPEYLAPLLVVDEATASAALRQLAYYNLGDLY